MEYLPGGESLVGDAAEISAGTGALLELLAPAFPNITWTPTEYIPPQRVTSTDTQWARWGKIGTRYNILILNQLLFLQNCFKKKNQHCRLRELRTEHREEFLQLNHH